MPQTLPLPNNPLSQTHKDGLLALLRDWPEQMANLERGEAAGIDLSERKQAMIGLKTAAEAILKNFFPEVEIPS